ncbi:MAG: hypothetical protein NXI14_00745 [bacterium]|nr:hypothetical protein [bacterium]
MKQAKIAIIVVCLALAGFLIWRALDKGPSLDDSSRVINVITGEVSKMDRAKLSVIPYPDSQGRRALVPAMRDDNGNWTVAGTFRSAVARVMELENLSADDLAIDPETFELRK